MPFHISNHVLLNILADGLGIEGSTYNKLNVFLCGKSVQPAEKLRELLGVLVADNLEEIIDKNMGDIIVAGVKTADEASYKLIRADAVRTCLDKASLIGNIEGELLLLFDANDIAVLTGDCLPNQLNKALGLSGNP